MLRNSNLDTISTPKFPSVSLPILLNIFRKSVDPIETSIVNRISTSSDSWLASCTNKSGRLFRDKGKPVRKAGTQGHRPDEQSDGRLTAKVREKLSSSNERDD